MWPFVALLCAASCSWSPLPAGATEQALDMHRVWALFLVIGLAVFAVVFGLIVFCVVRFRERPDGASVWPKQFRRNDKMEIVYTLLPLALVAGLFAVVYPVERRVEALEPAKLTVDVTGYRWSWRFAYRDLGVTIDGTPNRPPEFLLPLNETTRLDVSSADVDHSFWVPEFLFKRDAIPGLRNEFDLTPNRAGRFRGECGEFCGLQHALTTFEVRVVPRPEFDAWIAAHRRAKATS